MNQLKRIEIDITTQPGSYTDGEIREAQKLSEEIRNAIRKVGILYFKAIAQMYDFKQLKMYKRLGIPTMGDWIVSMGYTPTSYYRYMGIYEALTVGLGIPIEDYEKIDLAKLAVLQSLIKAGAPKDVIMTALEEAMSYDKESLQVSTDEKIRKLETGKDVSEGEDIDGAITDPKELLEPGYYKIVPLNEKEDRKNNPIHNKGMARLKKIVSEWYFNAETKSFTIRVRR